LGKGSTHHLLELLGGIQRAARVARLRHKLQQVPAGGQAAGAAAGRSDLAGRPWMAAGSPYQLCSLAIAHSTMYPSTTSTRLSHCLPTATSHPCTGLQGRQQGSHDQRRRSLAPDFPQRRLRLRACEAQVAIRALHALAVVKPKAVNAWQGSRGEARMEGWLNPASMGRLLVARTSSCACNADSPITAAPNGRAGVHRQVLQVSQAGRPAMRQHCPTCRHGFVGHILEDGAAQLGMAATVDVRQCQDQASAMHGVQLGEQAVD
jgi:hypothetical protein